MKTFSPDGADRMNGPSSAAAQTAQTLALREQQLSTLFENIPDLIVRYDRELRRTYVNPAWERSTGLVAADVVNKHINDAPKGAKFSSEYLGTLRSVLETGTPRTMEFTWKNAYNKTLLLNCKIVPEYDVHGAIVGALAVCRDLSERRESEDLLRRLNRELRAITRCNRTLLHVTDVQTLLDEVCHIICNDAGYRLAWIGYAEHDADRTVRPVAWAGTNDGYLVSVNITWADAERGRGPVGTAIRTGETTYLQDFKSEPGVAFWRENALQRGYRSCIGLPLKDEQGAAFGALAIYSTEPDFFTTDEIRLLEELANNLAFGIIVLRTRAASKRAEDALRESEQKYRLLSRKLMEAREDERRHIAHELHDEIGQELTGLKLSVEAVRRASDGAVKENLTIMQQDISRLMSRVRSLSLNLRPVLLDDYGLLPALEWYFARYAEQTRVRVGFKQEGMDRRPAPEVEIALFRVIQEALTNVARHAEAAEANVSLSCTDRNIVALISDNGAGFAMDDVRREARTFGLAGMQERISDIGGSLDIHSAPGSGTILTAMIPLLNGSLFPQTAADATAEQDRTVSEG
jgi:PAS domain S-box-containing protein